MQTSGGPPAAPAEDKDPGRILALTAARVADENLGRDIVILDMRGRTTEFDFFLIVSGSSTRQLHSISDEIERVLRQELGEKRLGQEGFAASNWILLDYGNVVIHIFDDDLRNYYDLEHLWGGAKQVPFVSKNLAPLPEGDAR